MTAVPAWPPNRGPQPVGGQRAQAAVHEDPYMGGPQAHDSCRLRHREIGNNAQQNGIGRRLRQVGDETDRSIEAVASFVFLLGTVTMAENRGGKA